MKKYRCMNCHTDLEQVDVFSKCMQVGTVDVTKLVDFGAVEQVHETLYIECPKCFAQLNDITEGEDFKPSKQT